MGNICRSPLAEGVFRHYVESAGLGGRIAIDSAGTGDWHVGEKPDRRIRQVARRHGIDLDGQQARQVHSDDLVRFDQIFTMDKSNLHDVLYLDVEDRYGYKVRLFREFDPDPGDFQVPDPYYGGPDGFEQVYDIVDRTSRLLLERLIEEYRIPASRSDTSSTPGR
jgi:protein-tyrosine phosphatase